MKKSLIAILIAGIQAVTIMQVFAASDRCTVVEAEGNQLVLECKKETSGFEPGAAIKIKTERKSGAIEGC